MQKKTITESEYELMRILWAADKPLGMAEIIKQLPKDKWTRNAAATLLLRLADKGFAAYEKNGKLNFYYAAVKQDDYGRKETKSLLKRLYNGSIKNLVASLYEKGEIDNNELDGLRQLLNKDK
ncbi:MAG: BlaI/MecI/CopY family transcriptional regulator [Clostridia bacterium]|nr:BlaI/MecI/CopY family transcriptional regulator [Clostridia bacterium]